jgi:hypothetical protein
MTTTQDGSIVVRWWRPSDKNGRCDWKRRKGNHGHGPIVFLIAVSKDKRTMKDEFEALGGTYLQFSLYKENKDTMEAVNNICKTCR